MSTQPQEATSTGNRMDKNFAPGERPLYFNNNGLFSDPFLAFHLPEIEKKENKSASDKYLNEYWNRALHEGYNDFNHVYAQMLSIWDQYSDLLEGYNEAQLEERWIKPIFKLLGWSYEVQDSKTRQAKRNVPDYSLFATEQDYLNAKKTQTDEAYFKHVLAVADAKAWELPLDGVGRTNNNPSYQIVRYMEHADCKWGILTNGRFWRLYSTGPSSRHTSYFEIDLESLLTKRDDLRFLYFYNFFKKEAFVRSTSGQCFLDVVYEDGVYYAEEIEENLKRRIFGVVESIAKGFVGDKKLSPKELKETYDHSLFYLFRLMFVLNCESKNLLAVDQQANYYEHSLRKIVTDLKAQFESRKAWSNQSRTYGILAQLFELLAEGDERLGVHGFGRDVFSSGNPEFFQKNRVPDQFLNEALVHLACASGEEGEELQFIDYKRLSEDHLGTLFEGLLEYNLKYADKKKYVSKSGKIGNWEDLSEKQKASHKGDVIAAGELYLSSGSGERKATSSYYTPPYIVDQLVKSTLKPLAEGKTPDEILELRICDPAMGSGHFLLGAIRYLEGRVQEYVFANQKEAGFDLEAIRWRILKECIFGVDLNSLAVELTKFSLWMFSARKKSPVEPLKDQIMQGDSLVSSYPNYESNFDWNQKIFEPKGFEGFSAILGNPPWDTIKPKLTDFYKAYTGSSKSLKRAELDAWLNDKRNAEAKRKYEAYEREKLEYAEFIKEKAGYKHQAGESQTHSLLTERALQLLRSGGHLGFVTKLGFYSDKFQTKLRKHLYVENTVNSMHIFQRNLLPEGIVFEGVDPNEKFLLIDVIKDKSVPYAVSAKFVTKRSEINSEFEKWMRYQVPSELDEELQFLEVFESKEKATFIERIKKHPTLKKHGWEVFRELDVTADRDKIGKKETTVPVYQGEDIWHIRRNSPSLFARPTIVDEYSNFKTKKLGIRNILPNSRRKIYACLLPEKCLTQNSALCIKIADNMPYQYVLAFLNCYAQEFFIRPKLSNLNLNNFRIEMFRIPTFKENEFAKQIVEIVTSMERKSKFDYDTEPFTPTLEAMVLFSFGISSDDGIIKTMYDSFECPAEFSKKVIEEMRKLEKGTKKVA